MDDPESDHEMTEVEGGDVESSFKDTKAGHYDLNSFITHLGPSVHCGHYVCNVRKEGKWVYYNDAKVALTQDPPIGKGYIYIFRKRQQ